MSENAEKTPGDGAAIRGGVDTGGGAAIGGNADTGGGRMTGRDENRYDYRRDSQGGGQRSGDINFGGGDMNIWSKLLEMKDDIRAVNTDLRDLNRQTAEITRKIDDLPGRVARLEKTEIVVHPGPEGVIRLMPPAVLPNPPDSVVLSVKALFTILIVAVLLVVALIGVLVFLRLTHG